MIICKHCGKVVERSYSKYDNGWRHKGGGVPCRQSMAEPLQASDEARQSQGEPSDAQVAEIEQRVYDENSNQIAGMAKALVRAGWDAALRAAGGVR